MASSSTLPAAPFPILTSVKDLRDWRAEQFLLGKSVGFVPTMGALHEGHLSLVEKSLMTCDSTIVSIFVNPAQFAPTEDLATYPRTLEIDLARLSSASFRKCESPRSPRVVSALFLPPVEALYPSGITTNVAEQRGTFVEVKGLQSVMEGVSRPGFFRGVATVCIKLFNLVQDIQQALLLRRMLLDLHVPNPAPRDLIIIATHRDPESGLALSSRNAYLSPQEKPWATVLIDALREAEKEWKTQRGRGDGSVSVGEVLARANQHLEGVVRRVGGDASIEPIYVKLNDPEELYDLDQSSRICQGKGAILSGAVMLGKTRLIDNMIFDYALNQ